MLAFRSVQQGNHCAREEFLYELEEFLYELKASPGPTVDYALTLAVVEGATHVRQPE
jgi:hypothetical protein